MKRNKFIIDSHGRIWLVGFDVGTEELPTNWSLPTDESWEDGLGRFIQHCMDKHGEEMMPSYHCHAPHFTFPSKVTPPCVECSDMKLRNYKPGRVCPFCDSTVTHETITYACYYEHSESGLWAYIPYVHTLKNCMVCGEAWPEYLDPAMKGQIEDE